MSDWHGRRVLVTGASSGIGRDVARALLDAGAQVVASARRADLLAELAADDRGHALPCDLLDAEQRADLVARAAALVGGLDGLVHAAGVVWHESLGAIDDGHLRIQLELNLVASLRLAEQAIATLDRGGSAVFFSSTLASRPVATSAAYSASKAGLEAVVKAAALAGAERGVTVNAVSPGVIDTPMMHDRPLGELAALHPMGRVGEPADVTAAVLYLLDARWTTGSVVTVDGGLSLR